ncbi:MAG TPA: hypothetical protein VF885_12735 [Arthrobacter sp.]
MPKIQRKPVTAGQFNRPAWFRTRTAEFGPDTKAGEGAAQIATAEIFLDGELIGSITGTRTPGRSAYTWAADGIHPGVQQHGPTRFHAVDALVRTHLTELQEHPIARLAAAA